MDHLTEAQIVELLVREGPAEGQDHLAVCSRCRSLHELWTDRIDALREMSRENLDDSEIHRLRVLFRHLGPAPSCGPHWIATLLRSSHAAPAATRGLVSGEIMEYSAGPFNVILQVGAQGPRSSVSMVGQIVTSDEEEKVGGTFSLIAPGGQHRFSDVDEFGEFHLSELAPGSYRGTWWFEDRILVVPTIEIGTDDEP